MSVLNTAYPTLRDVMSQMEPGGKLADIAEVLSETNPILDDWVMLEGNLTTGHMSTVRTGLPEPALSAMYKYIPVTRGKQAQVTDTCAILEDFAEVDVKEAEMSGNVAKFRLGNARAHMQGMSHKAANLLFYGNEATTPESFTGFAPRFSDKTAENGENIVLAGGVSPDNADNASIWLVRWGPDSCFGIYPKGTKAGLYHEDLGIETATDSSGHLLRVYRDHFRWNLGLHVKNWKNIVRIQYNDEDLVKDAATGPDLIDMMTDAVDRLDSHTGNLAFYCNRRAGSFLSRQVRNSTKNSTLHRDTYKGRERVLMFDGIPVRMTDALLRTEAGVTV